METNEQSHTVSNEPVKRGPGRPKGSKNRPKVEASTAIEPVKRGRPKGSRNRPRASSELGENRIMFTIRDKVYVIGVMYDRRDARADMDKLSGGLGSVLGTLLENAEKLR